MEKTTSNAQSKLFSNFLKIFINWFQSWNAYWGGGKNNIWHSIKTLQHFCCCLRFQEAAAKEWCFLRFLLLLLLLLLVLLVFFLWHFSNERSSSTELDALPNHLRRNWMLCWTIFCKPSSANIEDDSSSTELDALPNHLRQTIFSQYWRWLCVIR